MLAAHTNGYPIDAKARFWSNYYRSLKGQYAPAGGERRDLQFIQGHSKVSVPSRDEEVRGTSKIHRFFKDQFVVAVCIYIGGRHSALEEEEEETNMMAVIPVITAGTEEKQNNRNWNRCVNSRQSIT